MASKSPIFPMPDPHYSDYGFDPQIDYFQVLHEARKHSKREAARPLDVFHFKLQKPISKDDSRRSAKNKKRGRWWRNALLFWKRKGNDRRSGGGGSQATRYHLTASVATPCSSAAYPSSPHYAYPYQAASIPVYMTESGGAGASAPSRRSGGGGWGGACLGSLRLTGSGEVKMPYLCLRDLTAMDAAPSPSSAACPSAAVPIYLVT